MYQNKKIALFVSHIYGEYQTLLSKGVVRKAAEYGYRTEIYATNDGEDLGTYAKGEESILTLPNFSDIDGVIFASGTYYNQTLCENIRTLLREQKDLRVIEICENPLEFPSVSLENNTTAGELTEHLIREHNAKRICYLGYSQHNYYSELRCVYYEDTMKRHDLTVGEHDIFLIDEEHTASDALEFFLTDGKFDAVVAYNDELALAFWAAASERGMEVPRDFAITGCDYSPAGRNTSPSLTTVSFPVDEVGEAAIDLMIRQMRGENIRTTTVKANVILGGSCGCSYTHSDHILNYMKSLNNRISTLENSMFTSMKMSADFAHITDLDEGMDLLETYIRKIDGIKDFFLCLNSNWDTMKNTFSFDEEMIDEDTVEDDDTMLLQLAIRDGKRLPECSFLKTSLLPSYLQKDSNSSYVVCPLFFEDRAFGYAAMSFIDNNIDFQFKLVHWIMNITQLLQNLCDTKHTQTLARHLEDVYLRDVLTGLYNHHGFLRQQKELLQSSKKSGYLIAILMDLDMLKTINDQFGHFEGDFALKTIGQAITQGCNDGDIGSRFSGDEFYILLQAESEKRAEEYISKVEKYIEHFNQLSSKPYNISISTGWTAIPLTSQTDESALEAAFSVADNHMYQNKNGKTKNVLR